MNRFLAMVLVVMLLGCAGCNGISGSNGSTATPVETPTTTATSTMTETSTSTSMTTQTDTTTRTPTATTTPTSTATTTPTSTATPTQSRTTDVSDQPRSNSTDTALRIGELTAQDSYHTFGSKHTIDVPITNTADSDKYYHVRYYTVGPDGRVWNDSGVSSLISMAPNQSGTYSFTWHVDPAASVGTYDSIIKIRETTKDGQPKENITTYRENDTFGVEYVDSKEGLDLVSPDYNSKKNLTVRAVGDGMSNYTIHPDYDTDIVVGPQADGPKSANHPDKQVQTGVSSYVYGFVGDGGIDSYYLFGDLGRVENNGDATLEIYINGTLNQTVEPHSHT